MARISPRGMRWLKLLHLFVTGLWLISGFSLLVLQFALEPPNGLALHGMDLTKKFIDDYLIIPGAFGTLITGLIYGIWSHWGFFRHRWITAKWIITVFGILFGTFFLGPWMNSLPPISRELGLRALDDPTYMHSVRMNLIFGTFQVATLFAALGIGVLKPWKKKRAARS